MELNDNRGMTRNTVWKEHLPGWMEGEEKNGGKSYHLPIFPMKLAVPAKGGCFSMGYDPCDIIKDDPAQGTRCIIGFPGPLNFKETLEQLTCFKVSRYAGFWTPLEIVFLYLGGGREIFRKIWRKVRFSLLKKDYYWKSEPLVKLILR